ncbi:NAD(P)H-dependent nitrite reductase small subunit [Nitrobacteraceae bacterium AZCC 1564]
MADWKALCPTSKLSEGEPVGIKCGEQRIALYMVNGEVFATDDVCPHAFALMSTGFLDEYIIECPLHGAMFDIRSGRCQQTTYKDIRTFNVEVREGQVFVDLAAEGVN